MYRNNIIDANECWYSHERILNIILADGIITQSEANKLDAKHSLNSLGDSKLRFPARIYCHMTTVRLRSRSGILRVG
jgi:hypothetical protein